MEENQWASLAEMRGNMSFNRIPEPAACERDVFRRMFRRGNGSWMILHSYSTQARPA
jgi:hypothetical protein